MHGNWTRRFLCALLATAVLPPALAAGQSPRAKVKTLTLSGRVSPDGHTLIMDKNTQWTLNNAQAVRGHEGQLVTLKCTLEGTQNRVQVLSLQHPNETRYTVNLGDSAFRR